MMRPPNNNGRPPNSPPPSDAWFAGAPASRALIALTVISFVYLSQKRHNHNTTLWWLFDSDRIDAKHERYRYFSSKLTFGSTAQVLVGTALLFTLCRRYERELGTSKFILCLLLLRLGSVLLEWFCCTLWIAHGRVQDNNQVAVWSYAGPFDILGGLFYFYHVLAPRIHPRFVSITGMQFSEKSLYYVWFLQVIYSHGWSTILPSICGILSGMLYLKSPLKTINMPAVVSTVFGSALDRLGLSHPPPPAVVHHRARRAPVRRPPPPQQPQPQQEIPMPEPDPALIEQLCNMGFPRSSVAEALRQSHNNVEHAANRLLTSTT